MTGNYFIKQEKFFPQFYRKKNIVYFFDGLIIKGFTAFRAKEIRVKTKNHIIGVK